MPAPSPPIYLDYNATTPLLPEVIEAMLPYLREHFGNPSSGHAFGGKAREAVERARAQVAGLLGCAPDEVLFTSGGTEANNLAIRGIAEADGARRHLVTSTIEHPATVEPCRHLCRLGFRADWIGVDPGGRVLVDELRARLRPDTALVTVMHANNETGTLQPIAALASAAHERGALVHTDAAQSVGKVPVRVDDLGVDLLSVAGHKLYAPKGVGALYVRRGTRLAPLLRGAGHERGLRPGTENVAAIVGLGQACAAAGRRLLGANDEVRRLRDDLWARLVAQVAGVVLHGRPEERLPNTLNLRFPGVRGSAILSRAPSVAASTGSACHAGGEEPSRVLLAMGLGPEEALGAVRLSLGIQTTPAEVEQAAAALAQAFRAASQ